ncbi:unnamed protein product, partial [Arabidopsis halleri]
RKKRLLSWDTAVKRHRFLQPKTRGCHARFAVWVCVLFNDTWRRCAVTFGDGA